MTSAHLRLENFVPWNAFCTQCRFHFIEQGVDFQEMRGGQNIGDKADGSGGGCIFG